jgi:hypothetical protein
MKSREWDKLYNLHMRILKNDELKWYLMMAKSRKLDDLDETPPRRKLELNHYPMTTHSSIDRFLRKSIFEIENGYRNYFGG